MLDFKSVVHEQRVGQPGAVERAVDLDGVTTVHRRNRRPISALLRSGELRALQVRDIDFERNQIYVRRAFSENVLQDRPKDNDERIIPIAELALAQLQQAVRGLKPDDFLVTNRNGRTPTRQCVWLAFRAVQDKAGLDRRFGVHALRHGFCTALVRSNVGVETVRVLAGHEDLRTTQRYLHSERTDLVDAMEPPPLQRVTPRKARRGAFAVADNASTKQALAVKKANGERTGGVLYGFHMAADGVHLEVDEAEQAVIARIQSLAASGVSIRKIVAKLNAEAVPARGACWYVTSVARLIKLKALAA